MNEMKCVLCRGEWTPRRSRRAQPILAILQSYRRLITGGGLICCLDKGPLEIEDTLGHGGKDLEGLAREIEHSMAAVTVRAGINDTDNDALAGVTLGSDMKLLTALGALTPEGTHLSLVQGNDHIVLSETLIAGSGGITEPGTTTAVGLTGMVVALLFLGRLDSGLGCGLGGLGGDSGSGGLGSSGGSRRLHGNGLGRHSLGKLIQQLPADGGNTFIRKLVYGDLGKVKGGVVASRADIDNLVDEALGRIVLTGHVHELAADRGVVADIAKHGSADGSNGLLKGVLNIGASVAVVIEVGGIARVGDVQLSDRGSRLNWRNGGGEGGSEGANEGRDDGERADRSHDECMGERERGYERRG